MDLLFCLLGELFHAFLGAIVGILWPPSTAAWARWQRVGILLALLSVVHLAAAIYLGRDGWTPLVWFLFSIGCIWAAGYLFVGNTCRHFHENVKR